MPTASDYAWLEFVLPSLLWPPVFSDGRRSTHQISPVGANCEGRWLNPSWSLQQDGKDVCRRPISGPDEVRVSAEGRRCVRVAEAAGDGAHVDAG